jgi:hypothetical protein
MVIISLFKASTTNPGRVPLLEDTQIGLYNFYQLDIEKKYAPALDNYGQSFFVRSD